MARIGIQRSFVGRRGSEAIRESCLQVEARFEGELQGDFLIDSDEPTSLLSHLLTSLNGEYLDDIVGRGTIENIACYILFKMQRHGVCSIVVKEPDGLYSEVVNEDVQDYGSRLHFKIGTSLLVRKYFTKAIGEFDKCLKLSGDSVKALICRGRCFKHKREYEKALRDFSQAIAINFGSGEAHRNRGNALLCLERYREMMIEFDRAVQLIGSALAYNNRGYALQRLGRSEDAIADHTTAIRLDPFYAEAFRDRGDALATIGKKDLSEKDYGEADKLHPLVNPYKLEWMKIESAALLQN